MYGGGASFRQRHPELVDEAAGVLRQAAALDGAARAKFYGAKDRPKAETFHALNGKAFDAACLPALQRYTGVVYQHLDFDTLKKKAAAKKRILIVSGLFGLISGGTEIPAYKMPINPWLARYWREINSGRLATAAKRRKVLSLLPQAYAKAVPLENALHVDFRVQGGKKAASHFGKAIKGRFVRFLIENGVTDPKDFSAFNEDGFHFDGENFIQP